MTTTWYIRDRYAEFCKVLRRQTMQTLVHLRAQFEDDTLRDVQPVQFVVILFLFDDCFNCINVVDICMVYEF